MRRAVLSPWFFSAAGLVGGKVGVENVHARGGQIGAPGGVLDDDGNGDLRIVMGHQARPGRPGRLGGAPGGGTVPVMEQFVLPC